MENFKNIIMDLSVERELTLLASSSSEVGSFLKKNTDLGSFAQEVLKVVEASEMLYKELVNRKEGNGKLTEEEKLFDLPNLTKLVVELRALKQALSNFRLNQTSLKKLIDSQELEKELRRLAENALERMKEFR